MSISPVRTQRLQSLLRSWPAAVIAVLSVLLGLVAPLISPLIIALIVGAVIANSPLARLSTVTQSTAGAKNLLRLGVVLLGTRLSLESVAALGISGLVVIVATVVGVFTLTSWIGDRLGLDHGLVTLIATGFSICGAAAIAAVESGIRRRDEDVGIALAMVTIFGSVMILVIPAAGTALGLPSEQVGIWAGASIHEVAQVVAAASIVGTAAVTAATTIKLGRVALLAVTVGAARWRESRAEVPADADPTTQARIPLLPWFLIGFILAAAARSAGLIPDAALPVFDNATTLLLAAGMFGLGLGIRIGNFFPMPWRVVILSAVSTAIAALIPLLLIISLW